MAMIKGTIKSDNITSYEQIKYIKFKIASKWLFVMILWFTFMVQVKIGIVNTFTFVLMLLLDVVLIYDALGIKINNVGSLQISMNLDTNECGLFTSLGSEVAHIRKSDTLVIIEKGYGLSIRRDDTETQILFISKQDAERGRQKILEMKNKLK